jgi:hypothetical protein
MTPGGALAPPIPAMVPLKGGSAAPPSGRPTSSPGSAFSLHEATAQIIGILEHDQGRPSAINREFRLTVENTVAGIAGIPCPPRADDRTGRRDEISMSCHRFSGALNPVHPYTRVAAFVWPVPRTTRWLSHAPAPASRDRASPRYPAAQARVIWKLSRCAVWVREAD